MATLDRVKSEEHRERARAAILESTRANRDAEAFQRRAQKLQKLSKERARHADLVLRRARLLK